MLQDLESEAIYIIREVVSQCNKPAILFSGGKDSLVLAHLAQKAFFPSKVTMPLVHIDTGHNFEETIAFRDQYIKDNQFNLIEGSVEAYINSGEIKDEVGVGASRNYLQSHVLLQTLEEHNIDAAIGGGRRDEEKARAKERVFSHRDIFGQWEPKNQRPELWNIFNTHKNKGESFRVFPLSNWTEQDVWSYILQEEIQLPSLYYSHQRNVFKREGMLMAVSEYNQQKQEEEVIMMNVRCRTVGDITCTGLWESNASNNKEIIEEIMRSEFTERGGRTDDKRSETSMEDRKREGYF